MSDWERISPYNINTHKHTSDENKEENSIRELQVDPIPNSPNWHHKYFMANSKDNY